MDLGGRGNPVVDAGLSDDRVEPIGEILRRNLVSDNGSKAAEVPSIGFIDERQQHGVIFSGTADAYVVWRRRRL